MQYLGKIEKDADLVNKKYVDDEVGKKYTKPSGGIPKTDLASAVQTSLGLADSAVQDVSGKEDKSNKVSSWSSTPDNTHYPSEKLVKDSLDGKSNTDHTHDYVKIQTLPANADLNTYRTSGIWYNVSTNTIATFTNKPADAPVGECMLEIRELGSTNYVYQQYTAKSGLNYYNYGRVYSNGTWSDWKRVAWKNEIPTKVSELTNDSGFTTNTGTITGIKMNGASKGTSGEVDLGTVITAHQDISGKLDKNGGTATKLFMDGVHRDNYYASNLCRHFYAGTPTQFVIKTKIKFVSSTHMPLIRIYGYAYGLNCPIELRVGFYIFNDTLGWAGAVSTGAWKPEVYLFKYTENSVDYVAVGFKGACYFCGFQVDAQVGASGSFGSAFSTEGWSTTHNGTDTSVNIIPAVGTDKCIQVDYKPMTTSITGDSTTVNGHTVNSDVPTDAKFTDTTYSSKTASSGGTEVSLVTTGEKYTWNNKYSKPSGGIPKTDLASAVQASLNLADSALQSAPVTSVNGQTGAVTLDLPDVSEYVRASDAGSATDPNLINANTLGGHSASDFLLASQATDFLESADVINNLTSTSAVKPLSAAQGKILNDNANTLSQALDAKAPLHNPHFTGVVQGTQNTGYTTPQFRNIVFSTEEPTSATQGENGSLWIVYKED